MRFVRAATLDDLPPGGRLATTVDGRPVALFNVAGAIYAIADRCPHQMAPLNDGELCGTRLTCRWHGWTFEIDPAKAPAAVAMPRLDRYEVRIEGGEVLIGLPLPPSTTPTSSSGESTQ